MNEKHDVLKGIAALLFVILIQALVVAFIVTFFWKLSLQYLVQIHVGFFHWFSIIFCFNLIRVNIVNMVMDGFKKNKKE